MVNRRQPSGAFLRRVNSYTEPTKQPVSRIRRYKDSDAWLWTEVAAVVIGLIAIVPATIAYWIDWNDRKLQREAIRIDLEDRQTQRIAQAWELVTRVAPGNAGKGPALEYLNSQGIPLTGIDLSKDTNGGPSYLYELNLSGANLERADLSGAQLMRADLSGAVLLNADLPRAVLLNADLSRAVLWDADLSGAVLRSADLSGAQLWNADLPGADLRDADLSGANLLSADLSGANLLSADLSRAELRSANLSRAELRSANLSRAILLDADLSGATYLTQNQLDTACGNADTQLPAGLTIKECFININIDELFD